MNDYFYVDFVDAIHFLIKGTERSVYKALCLNIG